jgi:hypothetical protein
MFRNIRDLTMYMGKGPNFQCIFKHIIFTLSYNDYHTRMEVLNVCG